MEIKKVGGSGLKVSSLCLGSMQFGWTTDEKGSFQVLDAAWEAGINFIDSADIYSRWIPGNPGGVSEEIIGNWLKNRAIDRGNIVLATKVRGRMGDVINDEGLSRVWIFRAVENTLRRLKTDYIDLYQAHWFDSFTPIEETLRAFDDLTKQGKVRYLGCSNYPAWRLVQALETSRRTGIASFISLQPHYNLVNRAEFETDLMEICMEYGLGVFPYSPLAAGFLTGKYKKDKKTAGSRNVEKYMTEKNWKLLGNLERIAQDRGGCTVGQLSLAWLLAQKSITSPVIGPRTVDQLHEYLKSLEIQLSQQELSIIEGQIQ